MMVRLMQKISPFLHTIGQANMKHNLFTFFYFVILFALPSTIFAATITFDPQETDVGIQSPFLVGVTIDAVQPINLISLSLTFSPGLEPVDVSNGNSIISFWIDKPVYDQQTHTLTFSGIVPGGYSGTKGLLLLLSVKASQEGIDTISINNTSRVYLNNPIPMEDVLNSNPLSVHIDSAKTNISNNIVDTVPPESFTPSVARIPTSNGSEQWMLIFATQDKGSGIDHYEVRETNFLTGWWSSAWHIAESPYVLNDQDLNSWVIVRAYDKDGNIREESLEAAHQSLLSGRVFLIIIIIAGILSLILGMRFFRRLL